MMRSLFIYLKRALTVYIMIVSFLALLHSSKSVGLSQKIMQHQRRCDAEKQREDEISHLESVQDFNKNAYEDIEAFIWWSIMSIYTNNGSGVESWLLPGLGPCAQSTLLTVGVQCCLQWMMLICYKTCEGIWKSFLTISWETEDHWGILSRNYNNEVGAAIE